MTHKSLLLGFLLLTLSLCSCGEYSAAFKHGDTEYKYEVAKACYARGQYVHAQELFSSLILATKGTGYAEECLYMMGMSAYMSRDLETSSQTFRKYYQSYPRGLYVEQARYYCGRSLYESVPDPRLDQTITYSAINELQAFLDSYPNTKLRSQTQEMLQQLQDHLVDKELRTCQLYYDLGSYVGNSTGGGSNYEACIITCENALKDYPYAAPAFREQFMILTLRSRYHLARQSVVEKQAERFRQTVDDYYAFANEFPESQYLSEAQRYLNRSQKALKGLPLDDDE